MGTNIEHETGAPAQQNAIVQQLSERALWVCFLNPEGLETYVKGSYLDGKIIPEGDTLPKEREISTIQFWDQDRQITILPIGENEDGTPLFQTVEMLLEVGELPSLTASSLARRIKQQPYSANRDMAIYPLLQLPPLSS